MILCSVCVYMFVCVCVCVCMCVVRVCGACMCVYSCTNVSSVLQVPRLLEKVLSLKPYELHVVLFWALPSDNILCLKRETFSI